MVAGHGGHSAERDRVTQNALHDGIADSRPAADVGTKVFKKGKSRLIGCSTAPKRKSSHEKETADKTRNPLILQRIIAMRSTGFYWNIRSRKPCSRLVMNWWPPDCRLRNISRPGTWRNASARTQIPIFALLTHRGWSQRIISPSRRYVLSCWTAMSQRAHAVNAGNNGANASGAPSPPAVSNNAASLNFCIRPSAITSPDGLRLHCFHQVRERLPVFFTMVLVV